ncbi:hypothetical protein TPHA_0J02660 [Tetrapisispora phaffii CBS 4417]|uniref:Rho-GAP domain-containing protein n=1 Tax=Tetrapisispora phaffii (strain ATCC 24235 / CBS 4417 / NBRC 1672 / NRRL Y-8282 / UCD 70-5) TaxID=1071381 RepID=G8BYZ4_TETPH|nr:hypothetical protein TPHA_0J02660 [Tetrapisispora phaffii CBS 4417]CCE65086.1 hypothetical protein TPHA_0J02660 [Tetrapisispora phaffii CBS 4417]
MDVVVDKQLTSDKKSFPECVRCKDSIVSGHAYELGDDKWHTHCFSCYRCEKPLSCDSDFLVLGTGALICFDCSDSCKSCGKKIDDLAIILSTSNEAYCSDCFKCCKCGNKIEDLRYAKTKKGLFCLTCHKKLLVKKKLYEQKKQRLKKELPQLPPVGNLADDSVEDDIGRKSRVDFTPLSIPERSGKRPASPRKSSYLDEDDKDTADSSAPEVGNTETTSKKHERKASIDDLLSSTLACDLEEDAKLKKSAFIMTNNSANIVNDFLGKPPLRNPSNPEPAIPQLSKSETQSNISLDCSNHGISNSSESASAFATPPLPTSLSDMLDKTLGFDSNGATLKQLDDSDEGDHQEITEEFDENTFKPFAFNRTEAIPSDYEAPRSTTNDEGGVSSNSNSVSSDRSLQNPTESRSNSITSANKTRSNNNTAATTITQQSGTNSTANSSLKRTLSFKSRNFVSTLKNRTSTFLDQKVLETPDSVGDKKTNMVQPINITSQTHRRVLSNSKLLDSHERTASGNTLNIIKPPSIPSDVSGTDPIAQATAFRTPPLSSASSFKSSTNIDASYRPYSAVITDFEISKYDTSQTKSIQSKINEAEERLSMLQLNIEELELKKSQLQKDIRTLERTKSTMMKSTIPISNTNGSSSENSNQKNITTVQPNVANLAKAGGRPKFWKIFSNGKQVSGEMNGPKKIELASSISVTSMAQLTPNNMNNKLGISNPILQNPNDFNDVKLNQIVDRSDVNISAQYSSQPGDVLMGSPLVSRCQYEGNNIPFIITTCIEHVESSEEFLQTEGLYRKSGSKLLIEELEEAFSSVTNSTSPQLIKLINSDLHIVTGILKKYLRQLPDPLLTYHIYESLINTVRDEQLSSRLPLNKQWNDSNPLFTVTCETISNILHHLPKEHIALLYVLAEHVTKIDEYKEWNLMTMNNLSLIFAPGIIRDFNGEKDIIDMQERNYIVGFIFRYYRKLLD